MSEPPPSLKFPAACNGRAETAAAYRFLDNDRVGKDQVLFPHRRATLERIQAHKIVLIAQDPTGLDDSAARDHGRSRTAEQ
jgi:hypothetical protein